MLDRRSIPYQHWSVKVGRVDPVTGQVPDVLGDIVPALDDLDQSIANIVLTPKRSVPTEPEKCNDIPKYIDGTPDEAIPNITREIVDSVRTYEPRVLLEKVEVTAVGFAHYASRVFWRPIDSVLEELRITEVAFNA